MTIMDDDRVIGRHAAVPVGPRSAEIAVHRQIAALEMQRFVGVDVEIPPVQHRAPR